MQTQETQNWTMIIKPKRNLLDINLKELWRYKDLILLFVRRDFVAKYKQTILGPLWFIIQPLLSTIMFVIVFGRIAGIPTDGLPQILFYMSGLVAWNYFSTCFTTTSNTFTANANIFGKVYFPRLALPISVVISNLIQFVIQFAFFLCFLTYFLIKGSSIEPNIYILLIPVLLIVMAAMGLGFGIIASSLTTKYRDLTNLIAFGVQLWMYASPIIYPVSSLSGKMQKIVQLNPVSSIIETFRYALLGGTEPQWFYLYYSIVFTLIVLSIGIIMFNKVEQSFMDTV